MPHKISILARADVGRNAIDLLVTGCLTLPTVRILTAQIDKARELGPSEPILVDLTGVQHIDPAALEKLRAASRDIADDSETALHFALPTAASVSACPAATPVSRADAPASTSAADLRVRRH